MKAQTKIIVFLILFFISIILFFSANLWGKGILQQNIDLVKIETAENFMRDLDKTILNLVEYGGTRKINYKIDSNIQLIGSDIIEMSFQSAINLPQYWINLTPSDSSYIRERTEGNLFRIQLVYTPSTDYRVVLFTNGPQLAKPEYILLEKNETFILGNQAVIKIEITFMK